MSKQQQLLELRDELATAYRAELISVRKLIDDGVARIANAQAQVSISDADSLVGGGEAARVFCDEMNDAAVVALERYERNLRKEIARLGLDVASADMAPHTQSGSVERSSAKRANGEVDHTTISAEGPASL